MLAQKRTDSRALLIDSEEMAFHPHSFADDAGRLFWWKGRLLRGIRFEQAEFFDRLFREGIIQSLVEQGLIVVTETTNLLAGGFAMVVEHQPVAFVSYPNEWCAAMLKEAALTIIDLNIELMRHGLALKDAHPWNLLFDNCRPVFADLTSITARNDESNWRAYDEFCRFCYYPLILMSHGQERIARTLLPEYEGVTRKDLMTIMRGAAPFRFISSKLLKRGTRAVRSVFMKGHGSEPPALAFLKRARQDLESIQLPSRSRQRGSESAGSSAAHKSDWTSQQRSLSRLLAEHRPRSVMDLSSGPVWPSLLPALEGYRVVSVSKDPSRATAIYQTAREKDLPILPLIIDFIKPTPSVGYSDHYSIAATERLKCDMVIAFDLVNKIATEKHFTFDLIARGLSSFSTRWVVAQFAHDASAASSMANGATDGSSSLDEFIRALRKHFRSVSVIAPDAGESALLVCEK